MSDTSALGEDDMSGATRCDEIIRLIDEALGDSAPVAVLSPEAAVGPGVSTSRRQRLLCDRTPAD
ncbi:MAG TPA: hypothetical protein VFA11_02935 [Acidimicrobiales bacterium]|nr:hypothetical protein [Acidimicrobiales bacterium]